MGNAFYPCKDQIPLIEGMRYFYSRTDECSFYPRLEITMADAVDLTMLQPAAETAMARFRVFSLIPVHDGERYFLADNPRKPVVHLSDGTRHTAGTEENNGHLTWIGARDNRIIVEFFHGVSDVHGALPFVQTLLQAYCHLRYGESAPVLSEPDDAAECIEGLALIDESLYPAPKRQPMSMAFQLPGDQLPPGPECHVYSLQVNADAFDRYMRRHASSRTALFALLFSRAVVGMHPQEDAPIVTAAAADMRRIYGAEASQRDCTDTLPLRYDAQMQAAPPDDQPALMRLQIAEAMQPDKRLAAAAEIKRSNALMNKRTPSIEAKKLFCRRIHQYAYAGYTCSISSIGRVSFGEETDRHVTAIDSLVCASSYPVILEILQYGGQYRISYCTRLRDDPYVKGFQQQLLEAGIPCTCVQRENYVETLAVF